MSVFHKCRLCLKSSRNKIDVFKDDFPKMIELLTGIKVDPYDTFPKTSCLDCAKNVKAALITKKQIIRSHKTLLEEFLLKNKEVNLNLINTSNTKTGSIEKSSKVHTISGAGVVSNNVTVENTQHNTHIKEVNSCTSDKLCKNEAQKLHCDFKKESFEEDYYSDDSVIKSPNPMSDADDTLDNKEGNEQEFIETKEESLKPKSSDGVFFVKKRSTPTRKNKTAETIVRIKKKVKGRTPPTRVSCDICGKEVQSYWIQKHMETHTYNPVTCEFCGLVSKSSTALRHHVFYYHKSAADKYMCDQCGRHFRSKYRLNLHKKKEHGGTKDFECTTCGKKFFERMHLKRHIDKTHKNIRPYVCDFCGKSFKSINHIRVHERIHSKEAPYACHMCGESFKMKLTLRTHLKGVHNVQEEEKVFCDVCKRGFASDMALRAHINSRIHETEKCQYCSEMFTREYMINHLKDVHKIGLMD